MTDPRNRQYTNGEITVFWVPSKCIHATTCFRELIEVFNPGRRPWVNMDGAPTRRITEVVNKCPTQAIVWKHNSDLTSEELAAQKHIAKGEENPNTVSEASEQTEKPEIVKNSIRVKPTNIRIMKDGPIVVEGKFSVIGADNSKLKPTQMTSFCRCGSSRSMPYCDGTHRKIGFKD
ncbi:MAG: (4Fe-4S)-binding protein [Bacteroidota bacterium]